MGHKKTTWITFVQSSQFILKLSSAKINKLRYQSLQIKRTIFKKQKRDVPLIIQKEVGEKFPAGLKNYLHSSRELQQQTHRRIIVSFLFLSQVLVPPFVLCHPLQIYQLQRKEIAEHYDDWSIEEMQLCKYRIELLRYM